MYDMRLRHVLEKLKVLELDQSKLRPHSLSHLAFLATSTFRLKVLSLPNNALGDQGMEYLSHALLQNQSIEVLNLANNQLGDDSLGVLTEVLLGDQSLRLVNLLQNQFSAEVFVNALVDVLSENRRTRLEEVLAGHLEEASIELMKEMVQQVRVLSHSLRRVAVSVDSEAVPVMGAPDENESNVVKVEFI
mmetsp:Transcript_1749/g.3077  ORF Transcript_1749/g.3077 Transcript_1749/m.3077 type:complete len:190 (-) Transcript_1749:9-578(-)